MKLKLAEVQNETFIEKSNVTLIQVIHQFINQLIEANKIKQVTYNRYIQTAKIISKLDIAELPIQKITPQQINSSINTLTDYSQSSIQKIVGVIKQGYNYAMINEIIHKNPFLVKGLIIIPNSNKKSREIDALTVEEQNALVEELKVSNDPYKHIIYIALYTGMRIGEILVLTKEDISDKISVNKTLTRDKNESFVVGDTTKTYAGMRDVPILADLKPIIDNLSFKYKYLGKIDSGFIHPSTINSHFKQICKNAEIRPTYKLATKTNKNGDRIKVKSSKVNTHMLRHTFATRCIEAGMSPVVLQKILGHKNIEVTLNTYTSVFDKYQNTEIDKVEQYLSGLH